MGNEKDRMLSGELYDATDPQLAEERRRARQLLHRLNHTEYGDEVAYRKITTALLPNASPDIWIEPPFFGSLGVTVIGPHMVVGLRTGDSLPDRGRYVGKDAPG